MNINALPTITSIDRLTGWTSQLLAADMAEGDDRYLTRLTAQHAIGKRIVESGAGFQKEHITPSGHFQAERIEITSERDLADLVASLTDHQALVAGFVPVESLTHFRIAPGAWIGQHGSAADKALRADSGEIVVARKADTFRFSRYALFEHDAYSDMPDAVRIESARELLDKLATVHPSFADVGHVTYSSSSNRVTHPLIGPVFASGSLHAWIELDSTLRLNDFTKALNEHSWVEGMGFKIPSALDPKIKLRRTLFDVSVFQSNRIVFAGPPSVGDGLTLMPSDVTYESGAPLDTHLERPPRDAVEEAMGVTMDGDGSSYLVADLTLDTEIETESGEMTVRDYAASRLGKLRAQVPFRDSSSWNGILNKHGDGSPFLHDNGTGERHVLEAASALDGLPNTAEVKETSFTSEKPLFEKVSSLVTSPSRWTVKHYFPKSGLVLIIGLPEAFKTFCALDLALAISSNQPTWQGEEVLHHGPVLYVCGEGDSGIRRRVDAWCRHHGVAVADCWTFKSVKPLDFNNDTVMAEVNKALIAFHAEWNLSPAAIIVDTYSANSSGDENNNDAVSTFLKRLNAIREALDCLVVVTHHPGHNEPHRPRGASAFRANVDVTYSMHRAGLDSMHPAMEVTFACSKMKDAPRPDPLGMSAREIVVDHDPLTGEDITSLVLVPDSAILTRESSKEDFQTRQLVRSVHKRPGDTQQAHADTVGMSKRSAQRMAEQLIAGSWLSKDSGKWIATQGGVQWAAKFAEEDRLRDVTHTGLHATP